MYMQLYVYTYIYTHKIHSAYSVLHVDRDVQVLVLGVLGFEKHPNDVFWLMAYVIQADTGNTSRSDKSDIPGPASASWHTAQQ